MVAVEALNVEVSLRFGHGAALTPHCGVIHYRAAASLPPTTTSAAKARRQAASVELSFACRGTQRKAPGGGRFAVSLRLGHARALTRPRRVIHYPRAASLPLPLWKPSPIPSSAEVKANIPLHANVLCTFMTRNGAYCFTVLRASAKIRRFASWTRGGDRTNFSYMARGVKYGLGCL